MSARIFLPGYRGGLTEGFRYDRRNDTVLWVDIVAAEVHRAGLADPETSHQVLKFADAGELIGAVALTTELDVVVVCGKHGVAYGDFAAGSIEYFVRYPHQTDRLRSNDGIVDPWGHLWIGVMTDFGKGPVLPEGKLYRVNCHNLQIDTMVDSCYIPNGMAFSSDGLQLFWTDSTPGKIVVFDYDVLTNLLSNQRSVFDTSKVPKYGDFSPDGMCMTKTNNIFAAMFNGSRVTHLNSRGELVREIPIPARCVTNAHIGARGSRLLFVNTAHIDHERPGFAADPRDKSGDLGGYLMVVDLEREYEPQPNYLWGGKH